MEGKRFRIFLSKNLLTFLTIFGVIGGTILGFVLRNARSNGWSKREIMYVQFPGDMFLRMLKALILPLMVSSIVSAIGTMDRSLSKKIGVKSICYFSVVTVSAVTLGVVLGLVIRPGKIGGSSLKADESTTSVPTRNVNTADTMLDLIRNLFPPNLVQACTSHYRTVIIDPKNDSVPFNDWKIDSEYAEGTNTLGLVTFAIVMGLTLAKMGEAGKPLLNFFTTLSKAMILITTRVIWVSPIGVMFLVASKLLEIEDLGAIVGQLGLYFLTVLLGLFIHGFVTLSVIYFLCTREWPFRKIAQMGQVLATAFGTASSSATMPISLQCLDRMGLDPRVTRFVIPIGTTTTTDGSGLWKALATMFIAQIRNVSLNLGSIIALGVTTAAASIGTGGVPHGGLVTIIMVLDTVSLPAKDVGLIVAVDWLLDRFRTTLNVMSDALGACIIDKTCKKELAAAADKIHQQEDSVELMTDLKKSEVLRNR